MIAAAFKRIWSRMFPSAAAPRRDARVARGPNTVVTGAVEFRRPGSVAIGADCTIGAKIYVNTEKAEVRIGDNVSIGGGTIIESAVGIAIHSDVLISYQCILQDSNNHSLRLSERIHDNLNWNRRGQHDWRLPVSAPVVVGRGCWIGARAIILKGVRLGEGCVVGAGSVVTKSFPAWSILAGNPAKWIRTLAEHER